MVIKDVESFEIKNNTLYLYSQKGKVAVSFARPDTLRIQYSEVECSNECNCILKDEPSALPFFSSQLGGNGIEIYTKPLRARITFKPFGIRIMDSGMKELVSTPAYNFLEVDNDKKTIRFKLTDNENIYGLGQDPMAKLDKRDQERRMWQQWNSHRRSGNAGVPLILSSRGYGILLNSSWASRFAVGKARVAERGSGDDLAPAMWPWDAESPESNKDETAIMLEGGPIDLFIFAGSGADELLGVYSALTGRAPLVPKWSLGLIQSKNRYRSWEELIYIAKKYRKKGIPCDVLVIDWLWFKNFGDMQWDDTCWKDAEKNLKTLSEMGIKVLLAEHPFIEKNCIRFEEFRKKGYLNVIPPMDAPYYKQRPSFDHTNPEARKEWWKLSKRFRDEGIKGFWTDMGEVQVDPEGMTSYAGKREKVHNIYSLMWTKGIYEGNRKDFDERVFSLARTTYAGIEKYGAVLWSGDIDSTWQVLKDQVTTGLGVCLSGQQYWCTDVGGFFTGELRSGVKYGNNYMGGHGEGFTPELYIRWFEFGTFCPLFRTHGTRPGNEAWSFGETTEGIVRKYIELRYKLLPYIYSCAAQVTRCGKPIMRAMCVDFSDDEKAVQYDHQYMFGPALLVAPVVEKGQRIKKVYLPEGGWYDFRTGEKFSGGQEITVDAPLDVIPLFVREGSIIPCGPVMNYVNEKKSENIDLNVYTGADASFDLYEDDGVTYGYENGKFSDTVIKYSQADKLLTICGTKGIYDGMPEKRNYTVRLHGVSRPEKVTLNGRNYICYEYLPNRRELIVNIPNVSVDQEMKVTFEEAEEFSGLVDVNSQINLEADCDIEPSGELTVFCTLKNAAGNPALNAKVSIELPEGWYVQYCPSAYNSVLTDRLTYKFNVVPLADAMPVLHSAVVKAELSSADGTVKTVSKEVSWGSGFNTRWTIIGSFEIKSSDDIDTVFPVEKDAECACYEYDGKTYYWKRLVQNEYNCFGYVDLRENGFNSDGDPFDGGCYNGVSYAKCRVYSPVDQQGYISISSEKGIKIWFNGNVILKSNEILIDKTADNPVTLKKGWNDVLIKSSMYTQKPFSGREYGFNFSIGDKSGKVLKNLLYKA